MEQATTDSAVIEKTLDDLVTVLCRVAEENKKKAEEAAKKLLRRTFILRRIARDENIKLEESEFDTQLREMSRYYGYKEKEFRSMLEKNGGMDDIQLDMLSNKVLNHLAAMATR